MAAARLKSAQDTTDAGATYSPISSSSGISDYGGQPYSKTESEAVPNRRPIGGAAAFSVCPRGELSLHSYLGAMRPSSPYPAFFQSAEPSFGDREI